MSGKVSGQVWDLDMRALIEQARCSGQIAPDLKIEPQPLRTVLLALADHADHNGRNVYPGVELLVWKTELSERRVRALLSLLRKLGILVPVRYLGGGRGHATEYRLEFRSAPHKPALQEKHAADDTLSGNPDAGDSVSDERVQSSPESLPAAFERVQPEPERVQPEPLNPAVTGPPTGLTVKRNVTGEPSGEPSRARARETVQNNRPSCIDCGRPLRPLATNDPRRSLNRCDGCLDPNGLARASPTVATEVVA